MLPTVRSSAGAKIPSIGLGTWQMHGQVAYQSVRTALEVGYTHIDTAQMYDNEAEVGRAVADSGVGRGNAFITSKLKPGSLTPEAIPAAVEASAAALGGYIDLLLIHWPDNSVSLEATLAGMRAQQDRGLVRAIGVSNFPEKQLKRAAQLAPIACNQVEYHPFIAQTRLRDCCRRERVVLVAYCPLARGLVLNDPVVISVARRLERTPAQVVLRWLVQQQGVVAIPKATNAAHIAENIAVDDFDLSMLDMANISSLARNQRLIDPPFAPRW
jgi:2,5-diketo-D-gluconate reductase B